MSILGAIRVRQIIYLGGIVNDSRLSKHLKSRRQVEEVLSSTGIPLTTLRAAIIIGSGSASFEIIRDLVEKLRNGGAQMVKHALPTYSYKKCIRLSTGCFVK